MSFLAELVRILIPISTNMPALWAFRKRFASQPGQSIQDFLADRFAVYFPGPGFVVPSAQHQISRKAAKPQSCRQPFGNFGGLLCALAAWRDFFLAPMPLPWSFALVKIRVVSETCPMPMTLDQIVEATREMPGEVVAELIDRILVARHGDIESSVAGSSAFMS